MDNLTCACYYSFEQGSALFFGYAEQGQLFVEDYISFKKETSIQDVIDVASKANKIWVNKYLAFDFKLPSAKQYDVDNLEDWSELQSLTDIWLALKKEKNLIIKQGLKIQNNEITEKLIKLLVKSLSKDLYMARNPFVLGAIIKSFNETKIWRKEWKRL